MHSFYEAVGLIISAQDDQPVKNTLIEKLMAVPNQNWREIVSQSSMTQKLADILSINTRVCKSLGQSYGIQLNHIWTDILNAYKQLEHASGAASAFKKETLTLISEWLSVPNDNNASSLISPLLDVILFDVRRLSNVSETHEVKLLSTLVVIVGKLKDNITSEIPRIFDALLDRSLTTVKKNVINESFEFRSALYELIREINMYCFDAFLNIPRAQLKLVIEAVVWAITTTDIAIGFQILNTVRICLTFTKILILNINI